MEKIKEPPIRFQYTEEGYLEAKKWLEGNGVWDKVSHMDGYSIVSSANHRYAKE